MLYSEPIVAEVDRPARSLTPNRRRHSLILGAAMVAALLVGSSLRLWRPFPTVEKGPPGTVGAVPGSPDFAQPFHAAAPTLRLASPGLLASTPSQARLQTLAVGRSDPFASVLTPDQIGVVSPAVASPAPPLLAGPPFPQPLPITAITAPVGAGAVTLPAGGATSTEPGVGAVPQGEDALNAKSTSVLDQIAVTGVVQVGDHISVIIAEPGSPGGRRVAVGETLATGVRLQRVDLSETEPMVVLRHRGNDYYRSVGLGGHL
ncbi:MAG: hypothetical protein VKL98_01710 [Cyanobacteriota bacterium]|nr:hypothetical protein [Cyanobacteriota bacterium]